MQITHRDFQRTVEPVEWPVLWPLWERRKAARKERKKEAAKNLHRNASPNAQRRAVRKSAANQDQENSFAIFRAQWRTLKSYGATFQTRVVVERYFLMKKYDPRVTMADVARVLGIDPSQARKQMKRACDIYLIVKAGRSYLWNVKSLLKWEQAGKDQRAEAVKRPYPKEKKQQADAQKIVGSCKCMNIKDESEKRVNHTRHIGTDDFLTEISDFEARNQQIVAAQMSSDQATAYWIAKQNAGVP